MNCQEFWDARPEPDNAEGRQHLLECDECARRMSRQQRLEAGLGALRQEWRTVEAPPRVEQGVVAAFRSQQAHSRSRSLRHVWVPLFTWATAAACLVALALLLVRPHEPPAAHHINRSGGIELAAVQPAASAATADDDESSSDGFLPLPDAQRIAPGESVNVVRVEVPRSAMLVVGLPVNPERVSELVEADVMLGSDGLARAVRFVQ